jgi:hypothetical protein
MSTGSQRYLVQVTEVVRPAAAFPLVRLALRLDDQEVGPLVGLCPKQRVHPFLDRFDFGEVHVHGGELARLGERDA